jgi:hypothetical protein
MTERLIEKIDRFAAEANIKEVTPEIRMFAWLVENAALISFWEASVRQVEYQQKVRDSFLDKEKQA